MTQREGKAAAAPRAATADVGGRGADAASLSAERRSSLDALCASLSTHERRELLALVRRQGLLYAHQLPHQNGSKATPQSRWQKAVDDLMNGNASGTPPRQPLQPIDAELDATQQEAVAKALSTADVCLIAGLPGTGKSRVVREIVLQATQRGENVLLLAPRAAPVDRILEALGGHESVLPLRLRDSNEALAAHLCTFTYPERLRRLREGTLASALKAKTQAEDRCRAHGTEKNCWPELQAIAAESTSLRRQLADAKAAAEKALVEISARIAAWRQSPPTAPADALVAEYLGRLAAFQAEERSLCAKEDENLLLQRQTADEAIAADSGIARLQAVVEARRSGRWWTVKWWQALVAGAVPARIADLQKRRHELHDRAAELRRRAEDIVVQQQIAKERFSAEIAELQRTEIEKQQAQLRTAHADLERQANALAERWQRLVNQIEMEHCRPARCEPAAIEPAFASWQEQLRRDEQACQFANQWASYLHDTVDNLGQKLVALSNLVAGSLTAFETDKQVLAGMTGKTFDLVILEEAHDLAESDFHRIANHARRCILVGEPAWQYEPLTPFSPGGEGKGARGGKARRAGAPGFVEKLWNSLHKGPSTWPYSWLGGPQRLSCRFRDVSPAERSWIESEQLADFPEIELRILSCPDADPVLAEVVFPPTWSIAEAKRLIFQELQELPMRAEGAQLRWLESDELVSLLLSEATPAGEIAIDLQAGVREMAYRGRSGSRDEVCWYTHRIEFAKHAGWDRQQATAWAGRHLPCVDSPRTCLLQIPYRMAPALAEFLSDAVFSGAYELSRTAGANAEGCGVVFVPVPALRKAEPGNADLPKGGAGLELDLTTARCTDRLPPDLRTNLPAKGFVNYPEARSVVRKLEELVRQENHPGLAVVALYAGQVELIRGLIKKSEVLRQSSLPIEVGLPGDFTHREFPIVLLSLTRSHSHRAVTFAEDFSHLALAMTRARTQLYMFGDAGTLVQRSRTTEANGRAEQQAISILVQYMQGLGKHAQAFQLCGSDS